MMPKSGNRFSENIMLQSWSMMPKSGSRFSETSCSKARKDAHLTLAPTSVRTAAPILTQVSVPGTLT
jgi:hypothetical protein